MSSNSVRRGAATGDVPVTTQERHESQLGLGLEVLRREAGAINAAADRLDAAAFDRAVALLVGCTARVVTVGAGTSGIIARKLAATLTSTGTPAMFLHPADALHGELGGVDVGDVAVLVSNSGETAELLTIVPYLANREVPFVALIGNTESTLARHSAVTIDASTDSEAGPLGLAPTSSTTVALALADALAMSVMNVKGTTADGFARNHPSGRLGRRLLLKVKDLMRHGDDNPIVVADAPWLDVIAELSRTALGGVSVLDHNYVLVGVVTDGDLRRTVQQTPSSGLDALRACDLMTASPITVRADMPAYEALRLMEDRPSQISVLPVLDDTESCVGMLRLHDLVRSGI